MKPLSSNGSADAACRAHGDRRPDPENLLDERVEIFRIPGQRRVARGRLDSRVVREQLGRPRDPGRGRLMARRDQCLELVAKVDVAEGMAVPVSHPDQTRQDRVRLRRRLVRPCRLDLRHQRGVERIAEPPVPFGWKVPPGALHESGEVAGHRTAGQADHRVEDAPHLGRNRGLRWPEQRLQDDLEGEASCEGQHLHDLPRRPVGDSGLGHPLDRVAVGSDASAVKRRQEELAPFQVVRGLEHDARALAEEWLELIAGVPLDERVPGEESPDAVAVDGQDARCEPADREP